MRSRTFGNIGRAATVVVLASVAVGMTLAGSAFAQGAGPGGGLGAPPTAPVDEDDYGLNPSWSDRLSDSMKSGISHATSAIGLGKAPGPAPLEAPSGCPTIAVLAGTEAQRIMAPGASGNEGLRYQYSLANVGRECSTAGGRMSVKIGADGRVLLGPAGTAGHYDVPIRVVVFSEVDGKPVESKLFRIPTSIGAGQSATPFQFVSDSIAVPISAGRSGSDYSIKVGIDTGKNNANVTPAKPGRHRKKKDVASSAAQ